MNQDVLLRKMESLRRCLVRLEKKRPNSLEQLVSDYDLQDIICINLERAVQLAVDLGLHLLVLSDIKPPATMSEVFSSLAVEKIISPELAAKLKGAVGFRNIAVHEYEEINWAIVSSILNGSLDDFRVFMAAILGKISL